MREEENKKEIIEFMRKLSRISLGVSPFYRELPNILIDDHLQVIIVVQNLIFYNTFHWMIIRICLIQTLLEKTLVKKK